MKHSIKIRVSKDPQDNGVVACRSITIREKLSALEATKLNRKDIMEMISDLDLFTL